MGTAAVRCSLSERMRDRRTIASELESEYARTSHYIFARRRVVRWSGMHFRASAGSASRIA